MDAYVGEVRAFAFGYAPENWLLCAGQLLHAQQYQLLFAVIGQTYGGTGNDQFNLPDLRSQAVMGVGAGTGLTNRPLAGKAGSVSVALTANQVPPHQHDLTVQLPTLSTASQFALAAPATDSWLARPVILEGSDSGYVVPSYAQGASFNTQLAQSVGHTGASAGTVLPHENRQPYLAMGYYICADGQYPSPG
ncbi:tail fiber protein [Pseudomonas silvicola]|nr:tail fiber protein [Pseudomonas silvicola]